MIDEIGFNSHIRYRVPGCLPPKEPLDRLLPIYITFVLLFIMWWFGHESGVLWGVLRLPPSSGPRWFDVHAEMETHRCQYVRLSRPVPRMSP